MKYDMNQTSKRIDGQWETLRDTPVKRAGSGARLPPGLPSSCGLLLRKLLQTLLPVLSGEAIGRVHSVHTQTGHVHAIASLVVKEDLERWGVGEQIEPVVEHNPCVEWQAQRFRKGHRGEGQATHTLSHSPPL